MKIIEKNGKNVVIVDQDDGFARADSRLITLINKIKRKLPDVESLFYYETTYDKDEHEILIFDPAIKDQIVNIIKKSGYPV